MKPRNSIVLAALTAATACSSLHHRESEQATLQRFLDYAGPPVESFSYLGHFDNWRSLGPDKLVVWTATNNAYLLTVEQPCIDLQFAQHIGLTSTTSSIHRGFDSVLLPHNEKCRITEIRPVNYKDLRAAQRAGG